MARYYYWDRKDTIEETLGADLSKARHLIKKGITHIISTMRPSGSSFDWYVDLEDSRVDFTYTSINRSTGEKTHHNYTRCLVFTDCNFGGKRPWFVCPCRRMVKALYIGGRDDEAYCRHCMNLTYRSTQESVSSRPEFYLLQMEFKFEEEIEKLNLKTKYYKKKQTRKYKRYLALERKYDQL